MCGIMGFVGKSKNDLKTSELATSLLHETQSRGTDATGFYSIGNDGIIDWFKTNIKASEFVQSEPWKNRCISSKILIGHTRFSTHGTEKNNVNNHPHISDDQRIAFVHNGIISDFSNVANKCELSLKSQCDSEVILRLIESESDIVSGIKKVFQECKYGSFACLATHIDNDGKTYFYVFRNQNSPISFVNLKKELGQYFFCSTSNLWDNAVQKINIHKNIKSIKAINVPPFEIWKIDSKTLGIQKFIMENSYKSLSYNSIFDDDYFPFDKSYNNSRHTPILPINSIYKNTEDTIESIRTASDSIMDSLIEFQTILNEYDSINEELDQEEILLVLEDIKDKIDKMKNKPPVLQRIDISDEDYWNSY